MPLEEYWRKRDFKRTKEPKGAGADAGSSVDRRFVVQKHRASRLHYDFRLEMAGVLVSWAVPRGPSMRPLSKRRAARTEDHPLEYLDFEGVIPVGEYGGGDVIVWDQGTWEPEEVGEPASAVEAGELKFSLDGQRLRGRFVLVRTDRDGRGREDWLLIHKQGKDATIVSFGIGMTYAVKAVAELEAQGIDVELIDLRTIRPMDLPTVIESVKKTGRLVTVEEGYPQSSVGTEIATRVMQQAFDYLDAPILTIAGKDVPMPYAANLEKLALTTTREVVEAARSVCYR